MRLNVNRVLHTPDAGENFHFEMDLSDLEFGGEKPVINPVVVDGQVRNKAGVLLLELQTSTTLRCRCSRCFCLHLYFICIMKHRRKNRILQW